MEIITTHKSTDFDGLASVIAGTLIYPGVVPVLPKTINPNVKAFLSIHKDLFKTLTIDKINPEKPRACRLSSRAPAFPWACATINRSIC